MDEVEFFKKVVGKHIRDKRLELNLTLEQLSQLTSFDDKHLGRIERGEKLPNAYTLAKIQIVLSLNSDSYLAELDKKVPLKAKHFS